MSDTTTTALAQHPRVASLAMKRPRLTLRLTVLAVTVVLLVAVGMTGEAAASLNGEGGRGP